MADRWRTSRSEEEERKRAARNWMLHRRITYRKNPRKVRAYWKTAFSLAATKTRIYSTEGAKSVMREHARVPSISEAF